MFCLILSMVLWKDPDCEERVPEGRIQVYLGGTSWLDDLVYQ